MIIKDGQTGRTAMVNVENRLETLSVCVPQITDACEKGNVFSLNTGVLTLTVTRGMMLHVTNNGKENMNVWLFRVNYDGGSTNHNRVVTVDVEIGTTTPTTNRTVVTPTNQNSARTDLSGVVAYKWDGVGTGMTGHAAGAKVIDNIFAQGNNNYDLQGSFILAPGKTLAVYATAEEIGKFSFIAKWIECNLTEMLG